MYFVLIKFSHSLFSFIHLDTLFCSILTLQFILAMLSRDKGWQVSSAKSLVVKFVAEGRSLI